MIRTFMPGLLAALLAACAAAPPKDYDDSQVYFGEKPQPYFVRKSRKVTGYTTATRHPNDAIRPHGLVAEDGRVIVPLELGWSGVEVINSAWAAGKRWEDPTFKIVRLPEGTIEETPWVGYGWWTYGDSSVKHVHMFSNPRWQENLFDITFVDAAGRPTREYKDVGGKTVATTGYISHRLLRGYRGPYLVMDTTAPDGSAVSQLLTLDGLPAGPILPRFVSFQFHAPGQASYDTHSNHHEWGWPVAKLDQANLPDANVLQPATADGLPMQLPEGALGMVALTWKYGHSRTLPHPPRAHSGWAIVYPTPEGMEFGVGLGTAEEVLQRAASLPRYDGLRKVSDYNSFQRWAGKPLLALKKKGQPSWELVVTDTLAPAMALPQPEILPTYEALMARWERRKQEVLAREEAERKRQQEEEAKARAKQREEFIALQGPYFRDVLSGKQPPGRYWTLKNIAQELGMTETYRAFVHRKIEEERSRPTMYAKFWISESRELGGKEHQALVDKMEQEAAEARLKEAERKRVEYDNWAKFARAAEEARVSANASSPNPAMSGYTEAYKRNLEAWNKGQLNWFTPDHLKK